MSTLLRPGLGRFGALLTPQGKITADFLITEAPAGHGGGFLIDCPRALAQGLADKLGFYKLRAKVAVENLSDSLGVLAAWDGEPAVKPDLAFADPRQAALGWRILVPEELAAEGGRSDRRGTGRQRRPMTRIASPPACRAAASTSCMATRFRTRPTWTVCTASISTRAATSARRWCRGCSIAAPRGRGPYASFSRTFRRNRAPRFSPATSRSAPWVRRAGHNGLALIRIDRVADALDAGTPADSGRPRHPHRRPQRHPSRTEADRGMTEVGAPACRWPDAVPVARRRPVLHGLSRHRMGRAGI